MSLPSTIPHGLESDCSVDRLRAAVRELLAAARAGGCTPELIELLALHSVCKERGAFRAAAEIRAYIGETRDFAGSKPLAVSR